MLDAEQFLYWCHRLNLSERAENLIPKQVRSSAPTRRVQGGRGNVAGRFPSRKMGVTIQFEAPRMSWRASANSNSNTTPTCWSITTRCPPSRSPTAAQAGGD